VRRLEPRAGGQAEHAAGALGAGQAAGGGGAAAHARAAGRVGAAGAPRALERDVLVRALTSRIRVPGAAGRARAQASRAAVGRGDAARRHGLLEEGAPGPHTSRATCACSLAAARAPPRRGPLLASLRDADSAQDPSLEEGAATPHCTARSHPAHPPTTSPTPRRTPNASRG
jgi:hypothetical protein